MIAAALVFVVCCALTLAVYFVMERRERRSEVEALRQRVLGAGLQTPVARVRLLDSGADTATLASRLLARVRAGARLQTLAETAGARWRPARVVQACAACYVAAAGLAVRLIPQPWGALAPLVGLAGAPVPLLLLRRKAHKRIAAFETQFPECLDFISRSMRAGHGFAVALEALHKEFPDPASTEFRRTFEEHNLGLPLEVALQKLGARVPLLDVQFFVSAVLMQKRTGGNLAEILEKLADLIRQRFELRGRVRAVSAHGRMTGTVLSLIPAAVAAIMFLVSPLYVDFFFGESLGRWMLAGSVAMQLLGYAVIRKVVAIEI